MLKEFKEFALRGNVMDMAVGIIIGAAFTSVVNSLVNDVMMPPLGVLIGRVDFSNLFITLGNQSFDTLKQAEDAGAAVIKYGVFFNRIISFALVALAVFMVVKPLNRLKQPSGPPPAATTRSCPHCLSVIPLKATRCAFCTADIPA